MKVWCMKMVEKWEKTTEYKMFSEYKNNKQKALRDKIFEEHTYIAKILSKRYLNRGNIHFIWV